MGSGYKNAEKSAEDLLHATFSDHQVFFEKELSDTAKLNERVKAFADTLLQALAEKKQKPKEETGEAPPPSEQPPAEGEATTENAPATETAPPAESSAAAETETAPATEAAGEQ